MMKILIKNYLNTVDLFHDLDLPQMSIISSSERNHWLHTIEPLKKHTDSLKKLIKKWFAFFFENDKR